MHWLQTSTGGFQAWLNPAASVIKSVHLSFFSHLCSPVLHIGPSVDKKMVSSLHPDGLEKYCFFPNSPSQALRVGVRFPKQKLDAVIRSRERDAGWQRPCHPLGSLAGPSLLLAFSTCLHLPIMS